MHQRAPNARQEYRESEIERVARSLSLKETFKALKTLTVELSHFSCRAPHQEVQPR
jgi:hypothetical protein